MFSGRKNVLLHKTFIRYSEVDNKRENLNATEVW